MSTLFQLHTDLAHLSVETNRINELAKADDVLLIMGETLALLDWIMPKISLINKIYGLEEDWQSLNEPTQNNMQYRNKIELISDKKWVQLTQKYDKIVTIS
ncbi:MAG: hypothetical protein KGV51_07970 [Moraxellaceae bacterium]|nr:hypothetical protein [Moraxellaceae bacterium]